jgi:hypothetical protein
MPVNFSASVTFDAGSDSTLLVALSDARTCSRGKILLLSEADVGDTNENGSQAGSQG